MGKLFLSKGQLQDALSHYHAAVGMYNKLWCISIILCFLCKPKEYLILCLHYNKQSVQGKNFNWFKWKLLLRG